MADLLHPDAKLIELGRQFEALRAEVLPLDRKCKDAHAACEEAIAKAGIPNSSSERTPEQDELVKKLHRETIYSSEYDSFCKLHGKLIRLMKAIHRAKATTLEGFAVKATAIAFDQADFEVGNSVPADVAERELYRLAHDMAKVVKAESATLQTLITKLEETRAEYRRQYEIDCDSRGTDEAYNAMADAELAVIAHPCTTLAEVRRKAALALADDMMMDSLTNCTIRDEPVMNVFLRSLLGEAGGAS